MWKYVLIFMIPCLLIVSCTKQEASASSPVSFPQLINTPTVFMDALVTGQLILTNGCLRVNDYYGNSILLIWQPGFSTRTEQGTVQVVDGTGQSVASVGDYVEIGGGFDDDPTWMGLKEPLPKDCPKPYWVVGDYIKKIDRPTSHGASFPQLINTPSA